MVCTYIGDFPNNLLSFGFNFFWQKMLFSVFDFSEATKLETELGKREELDNLYMNKSS
jgi:hypothetical protein